MFVRGGNGLNNGVLAFGLNNGTSDVVTGTLYCGSSMTGGAGTERGAVAIATRAAGGALVNRIVFDETAVAITGNVTAANLGTLASKNTVTVSELGDSAVTTAKIYDSNVTAVKICDGNITADEIELRGRGRWVLPLYERYRAWLEGRDDDGAVLGDARRDAHRRWDRGEPAGSRGGHVDFYLYHRRLHDLWR